jgi:threonyl-tRNA synthetase
MVFSAQMHRMAEKKLKFERLVVDAAFALEMFKDNQYKSAQVVLLIYYWELGSGEGD